MGNIMQRGAGLYNVWTHAPIYGVAALVAITAIILLSVALAEHLKPEVPNNAAANTARQHRVLAMGVTGGLLAAAATTIILVAYNIPDPMTALARKARRIIGQASKVVL